MTEHAAATAAKTLQSCLTLWDPIDGSLPGSPVPWILQARILEWVAISFCNAWKWKVKVKLLSRIWPSATPFTAAFQDPPSMGFSTQEYWSGVALPSPDCSWSSCSSFFYLVGVLVSQNNSEICVRHSYLIPSWRSWRFCDSDMLLIHLFKLSTVLPAQLLFFLFLYVHMLPVIGTWVCLL